MAEHQLDRALRLFLDDKDYVSAITLAGASEEIFGELLKAQGKEHALDSFIRACVETGKIVFKEDWPRKHFAEMANYFRNGLKHYVDGESISVPRAAAIEILDRAIENCWSLTGHETSNVRRFMEEAHGC